jgi:hypothetical protein
VPHLGNIGQDSIHLTRLESEASRMAKKRIRRAALRTIRSVLRMQEVGEVRHFSKLCLRHRSSGSQKELKDFLSIAGLWRTTNNGVTFEPLFDSGASRVDPLVVLR